MNRKTQIKLLYQFMQRQKLAVMASVNTESWPEAAVVGMVVTEDLEIFCSTFRTSRKFENIKNNPRVALAIGWEDGKTVQYEGNAVDVTDDESSELLKSRLASIPSIAKYLERDHQIFYKINPKWIRFSDLSVDPWQRFEITF